MDETKIQNIESKVTDMQRKLDEMQMAIGRLDKQQIKIVGDFDGTNVPVTVNGIRRKIATATP